MVLCMTNSGLKVLDGLRNSGVGSLIEHSVDDYLQYQQTKNIPKPLFYDELIARLENGDNDLAVIIEKYSLPFSRKKKTIQRKKVDKVKRILRLTLDEEIHKV